MRLVQGIALATAALVVAFVWLRAVSPSDGVRVAPADYNFPDFPPGLPTSPLEPAPTPTGFRWESPAT